MLIFTWIYEKVLCNVSLYIVVVHCILRCVATALHAAPLGCVVGGGNGFMSRCFNNLVN